MDMDQPEDQKPESVEARIARLNAELDALEGMRGPSDAAKAAYRLMAPNEPDQPKPAEASSDPVGEDTRDSREEHSVASTGDAPRVSTDSIIHAAQVSDNQEARQNTVGTAIVSSIACANDDQQLALRLEVVEQICYRMAGGESLSTICRDADMPAMQTVMRWLRDNPDMGRMYFTALQFRAARMAEELVDHCATLEAGGLTQERINALKIVINTKQWTMSRLLPKQYGDHQIIEHTGEVKLDAAQVDAKLNSVIAQLQRVV